MGRFKKKPVEVEARQLYGTAGDTMAVCEWVRDCGYPWLLGNALLDPSTLVPEGGGKAGGDGIFLDPATGELVIHTSGGDVRATYGDWIVQNPDGTFTKCKPDFFRATYEPVIDVKDERPHGRACWSKPHEHGRDCFRDCPTCGGEPILKFK